MPRPGVDSRRLMRHLPIDWPKPSLLQLLISRFSGSDQSKQTLCASRVCWIPGKVRSEVNVSRVHKEMQFVNDAIG
jgi:hypothetical protein